MKKTHVTNLLIITFLIILFYILDNFLVQNNYIKWNVDESVNLGIYIGAYIVLMIPSIYYASKQVFLLFIKHDKTVNLKSSKIILFVSSLVLGGLIFLLNLEYYLYFAPILLSYIFYFIFLYYHDSRYVHTSQKNVIEVNDTLVKEFLDILGGKENIIDVSYEYSRLKVELHNMKLVNLEKLKELGAQGAFVAGNKLQARIGNNADELEKAIKSYVNLL